MQPAGLAAVEQAMSNGCGRQPTTQAVAAAGCRMILQQRWSRTRTLAFFATLNSRNRLPFCTASRLPKARKRARRIAQFVEMLENGEKILPISRVVLRWRFCPLLRQTDPRHQGSWKASLNALIFAGIRVLRRLPALRRDAQNGFSRAERTPNGGPESADI